MPQYVLFALCAVIGYFLGNFQTAIIISTIIIKHDIRKYGSGNAGTTNMLRVFGWKSAVVTFILDFLKSVGAVLLGEVIAGELGGAIAGVASIIGHDYPVLFEFQGGKGVASSYGVALVLNPTVALIAGGFHLLVAFATRYMSLGSILGMLAFFVGISIFDWNVIDLIAAAAMFAITVFLHRQNIFRLLKGKENKLSFSKKKKDNDIKA